MAVRAETLIDLARVDDGTPGVSPTATVTKSGDTATITITDINQTTTASVSDGTDGTNGVSVTAVEPQYYLSTSDSSATGGSWSSTPATFVSGYYYWTRDYITFSDGTHDTSTEVYNAGMTQAAQDAYDAKTLADDTNQYFWYAPTGADTGAHITEVPQDEWNDSTNPNYHSGGNLLARSTGIAVRDGMDELATFGTSGAVIGQNANGQSRTEIDTAGMQIIQKNSSGTDIQLANLGYGDAADGLGAITTAPYYTLGRRLSTASPYDSTATYTYGDVCEYGGKIYVCKTSITTPEAWNSAHWKYSVGSYSVAAGRDVLATGAESHAEGTQTIATGGRSHAEGSSTIALGEESHAEGNYSKARGSFSHAEGNHTDAHARSSHASGEHTVAETPIQTVIGEYNIPIGDWFADRSGPVFIIGNGWDEDNRSNAFIVDWYGNVTASGTIKATNETPTATITESTGLLISTTAKRFGNVVQLLVTVQNSSSIAQGGNIFEGTLSTTALQPLMTTTTGSYYSTSAITATLATNGAIVIRNEGGSKSFTSNVNVSFTYIVA